MKAVILCSSRIAFRHSRRLAPACWFCFLVGFIKVAWTCVVDVEELDVVDFLAVGGWHFENEEVD